MFLSYLKFLYHSKNQYSVHSPFVYQFLIKGLYHKINKTEWKPFLELRKNLLKNNNLFEISDSGAGPKIFKDNKKTTPQCTKTATITLKKAKILFKIIQYFQPKTILELGTVMGLETTAMYLASKNTKITSVKDFKNIENFAPKTYDWLQCKNINIQYSTYDKFLSNLSNKTIFDAIYISGNYTYTATLEYFSKLISYVSNDSLIIFDNIYRNREMRGVWQEMIKNEKVTVSINLFYFGLIFFRKEQKKEHFVLRP